MKAIAVFIPSLHGGGAERAMVNFAGEIARRGRRVDLVVARRQGALISIVPDGVRIIDLMAARVMTALPPLVRYLRSERPQALFATISNANVVAALASRCVRQRPRLILRQSNAPLSEPKVTVAMRVTHYALPRLYRLADEIIAVSEGVAAELVSMDCRLARQLSTIPTPVLSDEVLQMGTQSPGHPWLEAGGAPVILGAGRLVRRKGFEDLLRAFAQVRAVCPARLVIIGEGEDRARLERMVEEMGIGQDVSLPGFSQNPFAFMSRAAVFALSSHTEGLPNVLIQAMAFGTPVVSTNCRSGPAEILDHGRLGELVPVGDPDAMAAGILRALARGPNPEAQASVRARFGVAQATTAYLALAGIE